MFADLDPGGRPAGLVHVIPVAGEWWHWPLVHHRRRPHRRILHSRRLHQQQQQHPAGNFRFSLGPCQRCTHDHHHYRDDFEAH